MIKNAFYLGLLILIVWVWVHAIHAKSTVSEAMISPPVTSHGISSEKNVAAKPSPPQPTTPAKTSRSQQSHSPEAYPNSEVGERKVTSLAQKTTSARTALPVLSNAQMTKRQESAAETGLSALLKKVQLLRTLDVSSSTAALNGSYEADFNLNGQLMYIDVKLAFAHHNTELSSLSCIGLYGQTGDKFVYTMGSNLEANYDPHDPYQFLFKMGEDWYLQLFVNGQSHSPFIGNLYQVDASGTPSFRSSVQFKRIVGQPTTDWCERPN